MLNSDRGIYILIVLVEWVTTVVNKPGSLLVRLFHYGEIELIDNPWFLIIHAIYVCDPEGIFNLFGAIANDWIVIYSLVLKSGLKMD